MRSYLLRGATDAQARDRILLAFHDAQGRTSVAAKLLGVHKTTLLRALRRLGLDSEVQRRWPSAVREVFLLNRTASAAA